MKEARNLIRTLIKGRRRFTPSRKVYNISISIDPTLEGTGCSALIIMDGGLEDFYVYLDSDTNRDQYESNNPNGFTNIVKPPLILPGQYDVALENIIFKKNIFAIRAGDKKYRITLNVITYDDEDGTILTWIDKEYYPEVDIAGSNAEELIRNINIDFTNFLKKWNIIEKTHEDIFIVETYNSPIKFNRINAKRTTGRGIVKVTWYVSPHMCKTLGITKCDFSEYPILKTPTPVNTLDYINVYCDIISPSYYGGQRVHLLDIIPMQSVYSKTGTLTMYKSVSSNHIDNISIQLTNQSGEKLIFGDDVKVLVVLHFKRVM